MIPGILAAPAAGGGAAPLVYARFNRAVGGVLSNDDRTLTHTGGDWAQCLTDTPITTPTYLEFEVRIANGSYCGIGCYGGTNPDAPPADHLLGQWWDEPGGSFDTSQWTTLWFANYGMPQESSGSTSASGTQPRTDRIRVAVSGRSFWFAIGAGAWLGGGDPAAGTSPTFTLAGSAPVYVGADADSGQYVTMLLPEDYAYAAPSGFTPGIVVP